MDNETNPIAPTFDEIKKQWAELADAYSQQDSSPQTFYFSLINILKLS